MALRPAGAYLFLEVDVVLMGEVPDVVDCDFAVIIGVHLRDEGCDAWFLYLRRAM